MIQFKSIALEVKDIDTAGRRVKVGLSGFGNVDSDGDEVIVSDDEDYDVAIDYVKSKGESEIRFAL